MPKFVFQKDEPNRIVAWPVRIGVPKDGGAVEEQTVTARYRLVAPQRMGDVLKPSNMMGANGDVLQLQECLVGFEDLKDASGNAVTDDIAVPLFLSLPYAVRGLARGYWEMIEGRLPKN